MSEWWTYRLGDFLLFSPETYYRLFELYNRALWPLHLLALSAGVAIAVLPFRPVTRAAGRIVAALLALAWIWVAWAFLLERYATINWAARWFAAAFVAEALLLAWVGVIRDRLPVPEHLTLPRHAGFALFGFALVAQPLIGLAAGRTWSQIEVFGMAPDPTAVATLGALLFLGRKPSVLLLVIPLLWCAVSGATLWALRAPEALVLPIAGAIAACIAFWRRRGA